MEVKVYIEEARKLLKEADVCQGWENHYPQQMSQMASLHSKMSELVDELEKSL